jgi:eukaryotic-like serine/threonine-protein kinase
MSLVRGTRLGSYEIVGSLGAGGMGEVYRARDTKLARDIALKILPATFTTDPERVARFRREAQILAALNHPNIGSIYGIDEGNGRQFLVLELVEGESLATRIERGAIPLEEAVVIARQLAEALEAAHEKGIVHRDLKPANIVLTADNHVKVLDFGLAKAVEPGVSSSPASSPTMTTPAMTQLGVILGTAAYMAPEQAKGRAADKRSDVWAFGCVLFEMLSGKRPFEGEDVSDTLAAVLRGEPDWNAIPATVPASITTLIRRCLEKDRKRRVGDVAAALYVLTAPPTGSGGPAVPQAIGSDTWRRVAAAALVAAAATAGITTTIVRSLTPAQTRPVTRFTIALPDGQQFTNPGRNVLAISPDGRQVVYNANNRLYLRPMSAAEARPIPGTESAGASNPVFSPDGQSIAFWSFADSTLKRISVSGGTAVTLFAAANPLGVSWGADGILFPVVGKGIMRVPASGGNPELIVKVGADEIASGPQMLPGGNSVLFTLGKNPTASNATGDADIVIQRLNSGDRQTIIRGGGDGRYIDSGHIVYATGGTLFAVAFDAGGGKIAGSPVPVIEGVRRAASVAVAAAAHFGTSASGTVVYVPGPAGVSAGQLELVAIDRTGRAEVLKLPLNSYQHPRISPDGKQVTFTTEERSETIIWVYELAGTSAPRRLTFGGRNQFPIWSADGQWIAFQSDRESDGGIFRLRADGSGAAERLTKADRGTSHVPESWSPDGKSFSYTISADSRHTLALYSLQEKRTTVVAGLESSNPFNSAISPDGRWIAYSWRSFGAASVQVQPIPPTGARYQVSKETGHHPVWSPDGKELFYFPGSSPLAGVNVRTQPAFAVTDPTTTVATFTSNTQPMLPRNHDITPDGQRFIAAVDPGFQSAAGPPQIQVVLNWTEELKQRVPTR